MPAVDFKDMVMKYIREYFTAHVLFAKTKENAIIPTKRPEDAGFDIYACIDSNLKIGPHSTVLIPTGIAAAVEKDFWLCLKERGSTGSRGMGQRCGVIDSGYRDEIFHAFTNTTSNNLYLIVDPATAPEDPNGIFYPVTKAITQMIVVPKPDVEVGEITWGELKAIPSERGLGKLGSSEK